MPLKLKSEYDRSPEGEDQRVRERDDARVLRVREPDFTRKRRIRQRTRTRDDVREEETARGREDEEARAGDGEGGRRAARRPLQPTWPASEYQLQYHWKDPPPTESPLLIADHMLFGKTRNISGATQKDVIPRLSEYKSQFIDHQSQPLSRVPSQPPVLTEVDGPTVTTPTHSRQNGDVRDDDHERQGRLQSQLGRGEMQLGREAGGEVMVRPAHETRTVKREGHEMPPSLDLYRKRRRRPKSTYKSSYKSPTKFRYWKGSYVSPHKKVQAHNQDSLASWFAQVLELRQLAQQYQQRSRGTHFSRDYLLEMASNDDVTTSDSKSDVSSVSLPIRHSLNVNSKPTVSNTTVERPPERRGSRRVLPVSHPVDSAQEARNERKTSDTDKQLFVRQPPPMPHNHQDSDDSSLEVEDMEGDGDKEQDIRGKTYQKDKPASLRVTQQARPVTSSQHHKSHVSQTQRMKREKPSRDVGGFANDQAVQASYHPKKTQNGLQISSNDIMHTQPEVPQSRDPLIGRSSVNMGPRHSFQSHTVPIVKKHALRDTAAAQGMTPPSPQKDPLIGHMGGFGPRHMFQSHKIPILKPGEEWGNIDMTPPDFKTRRAPQNWETKQQSSEYAPRDNPRDKSRDKPRCTCGAAEVKQDVVDDMSDTSSVLSESQSVASETLERARRRQNYWA